MNRIHFIQSNSSTPSGSWMPGRISPTTTRCFVKVAVPTEHTWCRHCTDPSDGRMKNIWWPFHRCCGSDSESARIPTTPWCGSDKLAKPIYTVFRVFQIKSKQMSIVLQRVYLRRIDFQRPFKILLRLRRIPQSADQKQGEI